MTPLAIQCIVCGRTESYPLWCQKTEDHHEAHKAVHRCRRCAAGRHPDA